MWKVLWLFLIPLGATTKPNFVLIVTDDQDDILGSVEAMPVLKSEVIAKGTRFQNMFVSTPICCPSRASILSGRYVHNTDVWSPKINDNCGGYKWIQNEEPYTFAKLLHDQGYITFFGGKYMNGYGDDRTGGPSRVPVGWDWWNGRVGQQYYYDYSLSINGTSKKYGESAEDYMQTVIGDQALSFLDVATKRQPFLLYLCPTAPHKPFTSEAKYSNDFAGEQAPRTPSFNKHVDDHHWLISQTPASGMPSWLIDDVDDTYRKRLQTLESVDQILKNILAKLEATGTLDNTYIIFSSDNGFHLGQFAFGVGKHQVYETDIRVPLAVRGPNVPVQARSEAVMNIDLGPTMLDLASTSVPSRMDGLSFQPLLQPSQPKRSWNREKILIEFQDHGNRHPRDRNCPNRGSATNCIVKYDCVCLAAPNNTYSCVRTVSDSENSIYCEFEDDVNFVEYFNMNSDPWEITNVASQLEPSDAVKYKEQLGTLKACTGSKCSEVK